MINIEDAAYITYFDDLPDDLKKRILAQSNAHVSPKGSMAHSAGDDCKGVVVVTSGQLRAYADADGHKEITLYRLFPYDMCLFSSSCLFPTALVPISLEAEEDSRFITIPTPLFKEMEASDSRFASLVNSVSRERFSDIFTLLDGVLNKSITARVAELLLDEASLAAADEVHLTQEKMASHLGSAREVVTRALKGLQERGLIDVGRGVVHITDMKGLEKLASPPDGAV